MVARTAPAAVRPSPTQTGGGATVEALGRGRNFGTPSLSKGEGGVPAAGGTHQ